MRVGAGGKAERLIKGELHSIQVSHRSFSRGKTSEGAGIADSFAGPFSSIRRVTLLGYLLKGVDYI